MSRKMQPKYTQMVPTALRGPTKAAQSGPQGSPRSSRESQELPKYPQRHPKGSQMVHGVTPETPTPKNEQSKMHGARARARIQKECNKLTRKHQSRILIFWPKLPNAMPVQKNRGQQKPVLAWEREARSNNEKTKHFLSTAILKQTGGDIASKLQEKQKEGKP